LIAVLEVGVRPPSRLPAMKARINCVALVVGFGLPLPASNGEFFDSFVVSADAIVRYLHDS
jgi:hypothetical protein